MRTQLLVLFVGVFLVSCKKENQNNLPSTVDTIAEEVIDSVPVEIIKAPEKKSSKALLAELKEQGFAAESYYDENLKDTVIMQKYFMAFLKEGAIRTQNEEEAALIQKGHLEHLGKMYDLGYADISGPFDDKSTIKGVTIYNVPTLKMADSLANADPAVKAGRLEIEMHPWWAAKGFPLR